MTLFSGNFKYFLDGEEIDITKVENFNNINYTTKVDGKNVYFTTVAATSFAAKKLEEETLEKLKGKFKKNSNREDGFKATVIVLDDISMHLPMDKTYWSRAVGLEGQIDMVHVNPFNQEDFCAKKERAREALKETAKEHLKFEDSSWYKALVGEPKLSKIVEKEEKYPEILGGQFKRGKMIDYSKGLKESEGKLDYSEVNFEILDLMAERFTANKHKYPQGNMKKPIDIKGLEFALFRHLRKMIQPLENDVESYKEHLAAILCNASMILDQLNLQEKK